MTYRTRLSLLVLLDSIIVTFAIFAATWIVYPNAPVDNMPILTITAIALLFFHHFYAMIYKLYNKVWAYASVGELAAIVKAITLAILSAAVVQFLINDFTIFRRAMIVTWLLHIIFIGGSRFMWRLYRDRYIRPDKGKKRTLIVGAGAAGSMIVRQLKYSNESSELLPIAFVDDETSKQKMQIYGVPVLGRVKDITAIVENHAIEHIVIAIPSLQNGKLERIVMECNKTDAKVQMIPKIEDIMTGKVSVSNLKSVEVEDLLGRDPVKLDIHTISDYVTHNTVLVTGAGGSIGSELCRQLMRFTPSRIVLVGHGEFSIYKIDMELRQKLGDAETEIIPVIGDVQDRERMFDIVQMYEPKIIYHAAAHKHVPLMEFNPSEAVKNNVIGTKNVAEAADANHVNTFVLVSTDKAVNPTNVMGATKRVAEMIVQGLNAGSDTTFAAVRFGNVLGSRGSVIPLFEKQIEQGGPVTVTDPEMTRYFMTIPEASRLVIQAGTLASGGEVFVLDMGKPVKIVDLARNLIKLSGYSEDEIPIEFTGKRPGEKMYEELLLDKNVHAGEVFEKIYVGNSLSVDPEVYTRLIAQFENYGKVELKDELIRIACGEKRLAAAGES